MATLGNTTDGASIQTQSADRKYAYQAIPSSSGTIIAGKAIVSLSGVGNSSARLIVYSDNAGSPDALLAVSDDLNNITNTTEEQKSFTFTGANQIHITEGTPYWIGIHFSDPGAITPGFQISRSNLSGLVRSSLDTFSDGPSDPFASTTNSNGPLDVYIEYTQDELSATVTTFATSVTSMPVNLPDSSPGSINIAAVSVRNPGTWTPPTDWVELDSQVGGGTVGELTLFYKEVDGSEGASATWTASVGTTAVWHVRNIPDWHGTTVPESDTSSGDSSAADPPNLTPSWGAETTMWLAIAGHAAATTSAWSAGPSNYSGFQVDGASSGGGAVSIASAYRELNASSEDPGAFTVDGSNRFWAAATVAIRPAGGAAPNTRRYSLTLTGAG